MDLHGLISMSIVKNNRSFILVVPMGTPYQDAHDATLELAQNIIDLQKEQEKAAQEAQANATQVDQPIAVESVEAVV